MIRERKEKKTLGMTILLVLNNKSARNVQLLITLSSEILEKKFKKLMEEKLYKEAFDLVYAKSQPGEFYFLDPEKMHYIKLPEYILVEELIVASQRKETEKASLV